jgi:hypothetical protein
MGSNRTLDSADVRRNVNSSLKNDPLLLLFGLFGILTAAHFYRPLDSNPVMFVALVLFFTPILAHVGFGIRKQLSSHTALLRSLYRSFGVGLVIFAATLFLNGAFDKYPSVQAHTRVTQKSVTRGRGGPSYSLIVTPSWRNGRVEERLEVSGTTFSKVRTGGAVLVVAHRGLFRLPWFSSVLPE